MQGTRAPVPLWGTGLWGKGEGTRSHQEPQGRLRRCPITSDLARWNLFPERADSPLTCHFSPSWPPCPSQGLRQTEEWGRGGEEVSGRFVSWGRGAERPSFSLPGPFGGSGSRPFLLGPWISFCADSPCMDASCLLDRLHQPLATCSLLWSQVAPQEVGQSFLWKPPGRRLRPLLPHSLPAFQKTDLAWT